VKLSTRNVLKGRVTELKEGMIMAKVKVDIGNGNVITSLVSMDAVKELDVKIGEEIQVLIKATSVMLGKD
jgi:molybdopterin-binding protein